jgi:cell fate regulator YaaT (PSP1 superfamily)
MPNAFGRQHSTLTQPQQNQQLFIVTFKCCRADVFYIQEDTGLQVKPGELVIVEADRGTDLGTVAHANVTWAKAREYKEHYAEEHYKWLMLFSRQSQTGAPNALNPNGTSSTLNGAPGSAVGGMGPQSQHGIQEPQSGDIKPKLIKRLAQNHEIQTLRDKEGNEAKAKRVCQQKVAEHRLNMEILDAEFQMYYFTFARPKLRRFD